ncbi:MAG TPA: hypothetical protein VMT54_12195 [Candidatus Cybelea sp.]|nr:hypothetical protein [Candidatus Cybelea sp.]
MKLPALAILLAALPGLSAAADPVKLSGAEIKTLFTGNTVHGQWAGKEYWSYFGADGWTTYLAKGGQPANGRWVVTATQYCSTWNPGGTSCYDLYRDGDTIVWRVPSSGERYPSALLTGDQLPK